METSPIEEVSSNKKSAHSEVDEGEGDTTGVATNAVYKGKNIQDFHLHSLLVTCLPRSTSGSRWGQRYPQSSSEEEKN